MELPEYWIRWPKLEVNNSEKQFFDDILKNIVKTGENQLIKYSSNIPKWKFLSYTVNQYPYVLHGSGNNNITIFEPRQTNDTLAFANQKAVYAAKDGIGPIFFAILNRKKYRVSTVNACIYLKDENDTLTGPFYFFSINKEALQQKPFQKGMVYILSKDTFIPQPEEILNGIKVYIPQLASTVKIKPVTKIEVEPNDFPFLNLIRGFADKDLEKVSNAMIKGEPLPEKKSTTPP